MRVEPEDRVLLRWLAVLAMVFAIIFTLNGFGFALRSAHVDAGAKGSGHAASQVRGKNEAPGIAKRLKATLEAVLPTSTPESDRAGKGEEARGQSKGKPSGSSVADAPATPDPPQPGGAGGTLPPPGQAKRDLSQPASDPEQAEADSALTSGAAGESPVPGSASTDPLTLTATNSMPTPGTEPEIVGGNPPLCEGGYKVESPCNGTHTYHHTVNGHDVTITVTVYDTGNGQAFNWTSSWPVERVVVKGGSLGANVYAYEPPASADGGLHAPAANDKNCHWAGLSYIAFCFGEKPPCDVTKTFDLYYPDLPEGARVWVRYQIGCGPSTLAELEWAGGDHYKLVVPEIPAGSKIKGEWLVTMGDVERCLGTFEEVLCKDKTNKLCYQPEVGGSKYEDLNGNGTRDAGEPGIGAWTINLYRKAWLVCDVGTWELYRTVQTNPDGSYSFNGLLPGRYKVEEELPAGWKQTEKPVPCEFEVTRTSSICGLDFGNLKLPDITVLKFNDYNGNGVRDLIGGDVLEPAISGWTFQLSQEGEVIAEGTTDIDGKVVFADLELGSYSIDEADREGWTATTELPVTVSLTMSGADVEVPVGNQYLEPGKVDLTILKAANPTTVGPGDMVTYRLTYRNLGDAAAEDFTIVDDYDQTLVSEVVNAGGGVVDAANGTITWTFAGPLLKDDGAQSIVYTVRVRADIEEDTFVDNVAVISDPEDVDPTNNTDDERVKVVVEEPLLPFTEEEESLPFTGGDFTTMMLFAGLSTAAGAVLRRLGRERRES